MIHSSLHSGDDFRSGCRNVSQCHHKQHNNVTASNTTPLKVPLKDKKGLGSHLFVWRVWQLKEEGDRRWRSEHKKLND